MTCNIPVYRYIVHLYILAYRCTIYMYIYQFIDTLVLYLTLHRLVDTWVTSILDMLQTKLLWTFFVQTSISISPGNRPRRELLELNYSLGFPSPGNFRLSSKVAAAFSTMTSFLISLYPHQHFLSAWSSYCAYLCGCAVLSPGGVEVHFHGVCRSITSLAQLYRGGKWGTENLTNSHTNTWCAQLHVNTMCKGKYEYVCVCVY